MKLIPEIEASKWLNLPPSVLRALRRKGQGPRHVILLRRGYYDPDDLDAWAESQIVKPAAATTATNDTITNDKPAAAMPIKEESHD